MQMQKYDAKNKRAAMGAAHLGLVLVRAANALVRQGEADLQRCGLSSTDFRVLEALLHKGPLPVNVIGPKVALTPGAISVAIDRLEKRGLVQREEGARDRRVRTVVLTKEGKKIIDPAFRRHASLLERMFEPLTPDERSVLEVLLKRVGKHAETLSQF